MYNLSACEAIEKSRAPVSSSSSFTPHHSVRGLGVTSTRPGPPSTRPSSARGESRRTALVGVLSGGSGTALGRARGGAVAHGEFGRGASLGTGGGRAATVSAGA